MKKVERKLSNLECTVLGLAWLRGPCSIYSIMKDLSVSASSYHQSRAGAAYSVAKRLLEFGLLERRETDEVAATEEGVRALREWVSVPIPMADITHSADLIRLRFFFLGAIEKDERLKFIDESIAGLQVFLSECEALLPANEALGEYFGVLATLSTIFETRARIAWLRAVRDLVEHPLEGDWSKRALERAL